jgi:SOS-response transcriptional repressor LexA
MPDDKELDQNTTDRVLAVVKGFIERNGYSPTVRDIVWEAGLSSTSVAVRHLDKLRADNKVTWLPKVARTLRLVA